MQKLTVSCYSVPILGHRSNTDEQRGEGPAPTVVQTCGKEKVMTFNIFFK